VLIDPSERAGTADGGRSAQNTLGQPLNRLEFPRRCKNKHFGTEDLHNAHTAPNDSGALRHVRLAYALRAEGRLRRRLRFSFPLPQVRGQRTIDGGCVALLADPRGPSDLTWVSWTNKALSHGKCKVFGA
jgi:hypothetical protein